MNCPSCGSALVPGVSECPSCGIFVTKFRPRTETRKRIPSTPPGRPTAEATGRKARAGASIIRLIVIALLGVGGAAALVAGYWIYRFRPPQITEMFERLRHRSVTLRAARGGSAFDLAYQLPGSPLGLASNGSEFIIGNRSDSWGAIRLRPAGEDRLVAEKLPIIEPRYQQRMSVSALTWNGRKYVGVAMAEWFGGQGTVFTVHGAGDLALEQWKPAPDLIGCVAWDGQSYWAATRRHTQDSPEPALLYRLDADFNVVASSEAPSVGCQGLAWDGARLWLADVFSDSIHVLDISEPTPRLVRSIPVELTYMSGIAAVDGQIWISEYGSDRLLRVSPSTRLAWAGGPKAAPPVAQAAMLQSGAGASIEELRRRLRSESWSERMSAEMELNRLGAPRDFDRDENRSAARPPDDTEVLDWSVELRDGGIFGSWTLWFGHDLFVRGTPVQSLVTIPQFARYTLTVRSPAGTEVEREFEAVAGVNAMSDVRLADARGDGEYEVSLFLHVQYVSLEGEARILNRSAVALSVGR